MKPRGTNGVGNANGSFWSREKKNDVFQRQKAWAVNSNTDVYILIYCIYTCVSNERTYTEDLHTCAYLSTVMHYRVCVKCNHKTCMNLYKLTWSLAPSIVLGRSLKGNFLNHPNPTSSSKKAEKHSWKLTWIPKMMLFSPKAGSGFKKYGYFWVSMLNFWGGGGKESSNFVPWILPTAS